MTPHMSIILKVLSLDSQRVRATLSFMSFEASHGAGPTDRQTYLQHQHMFPSYAAQGAASNAGFPASGRAGIMSMEIENATGEIAHYHSFYDVQQTPEAAASPPLVSRTPETSSTASSYGDTSDNDADEDAMVDAAMYESGILTSALLAEDHTTLDAALLKEMDDLLTSSREDTTQWNQFQLDSPSLTFPTPVSPPASAWAFTPTTPSVGMAAVSISESESTPQKFLPHGDGWSMPPIEQAAERDDGDDDCDVEMDAEPKRSEAEQKEMELLARQLKFLEAQREFLDYKAALASSSAEGLSSTDLVDRRAAILEKRKLVEAQLHKEMLTKVAKQQLENLKYMELLLLQSPLNHYRMTLMTPMESFIHLSRDPTERRSKLLSLRDEKIDATWRFIEYQSRNIDLERQFFYLDTFEKFGKYYTVDFSISKLDDATVDEVVTIIYNHFVSTKDMISQVLGSVENREYFDGVDWAFLNARFVDRINLPKRRRGDRGFVVQESNTVYYVKKIGETVVMTCDYIDKDDLHPYRPTGRIRKDKTVGVIVEPYIDSQGKQSVVMKRFSFIKHHFKNIEPTPDLIQAISTKVILWGQAVRFCLASRMGATKVAPTHVQLLTRSAEVTEISSGSR